MCASVHDAPVPHSHTFGFLLLQRLEARWTVTKILMVSADTATLAALDAELSACLRDMQVFHAVVCAQRVNTHPHNPAHLHWLWRDSSPCKC
jgi:hypothetical protein